MAGVRPLSLLVVTDLWPPYTIGGYELGAHDVVTALARRGHDVTVLTSTYGVGRPSVAGNVHRLLYEEIYPRVHRHRELVRETVRSVRALRRARRFLRRATFDLLYLFNPLGLSAAFVEDLCRAGPPVVAYVSDDWIVRWPGTDALLESWMRSYPASSSVWRALVRLGRPALRLAGALPRSVTPPVAHAQFVSRYIRDVSLPRLRLSSELVVPWAIDPARFPFRDRRADELERLVFVGQIEPHKGPQVAIDAVDKLRRRGRNVRLTLHGRDTTPFARELKARVAHAGLGEAVTFAGPCPRDRLAVDAYDRAGVLLFTPVWPEPFSLTLLEAFSAGLPVLASVTGGTGEILEDGVNALAYRTGEADHLAAQWEALAARPEEALARARRARALIEAHLTMDRMVDRVEAHLLAVRDGDLRRAQATHHPWEAATA